MKSTAKLKVVPAEQTERLFGSHRFLRMTRNPALVSPRRFEPTRKAFGDVVI